MPEQSNQSPSPEVIRDAIVQSAVGWLEDARVASLSSKPAVDPEWWTALAVPPEVTPGLLADGLEEASRRLPTQETGLRAEGAQIERALRVLVDLGGVSAALAATAAGRTFALTWLCVQAPTDRVFMLGDLPLRTNRWLKVVPGEYTVALRPPDDCIPFEGPVQVGRPAVLLVFEARS